jgi:hypothetical protein
LCDSPCGHIGLATAERVDISNQPVHHKGDSFWRSNATPKEEKNILQILNPSKRITGGLLILLVTKIPRFVPSALLINRQ